MTDQKRNRPKSVLGLLGFALTTLLNMNSSVASPLKPCENAVFVSRDIWKPSAGITWDYQLTGVINVASTNVDVLDIDLFDTSTTVIDGLHAKSKHVICYFSAGSFENWRPDVSKFQSTDLGKPLEGWEGENWLQIKSSNVRNIMTARLDLAAQKKCDGVDPDNVDGYQNDNGFRLTENDAVDYITFLIDAAHARSLAIGLKNAAGIVSRLVSQVEYSVQESCMQYEECAMFRPFIDANKPVFHVEYSNKAVKKRNVHKDNRDENDYPGDSVNYFVSSADSDADESDLEVTGEDDPYANGSNSTRHSDLKERAGPVADGSSNCAASVPGFSNIIKKLDLGPWVQFCD